MLCGEEGNVGPAAPVLHQEEPPQPAHLHQEHGIRQKPFKAISSMYGFWSSWVERVGNTLMRCCTLFPCHTLMKCCTIFYLVMFHSKVRKMMACLSETRKMSPTLEMQPRKLYVSVLWKRKKNPSMATMTLGGVWTDGQFLHPWTSVCDHSGWGSEHCHELPPCIMRCGLWEQTLPFPVVTVVVSEWWYIRNQLVFLTRYHSAPIAPINPHSILKQGRHSCSNIDRGPGY